MKAMIIAGGKGTRAQEISEEIPKALFPVNGKPVVIHQIELLKKYGITEFVVCIGHLGDKIKDALGDGSQFGVSIVYSNEEIPLGTGGCIKNAAQFVTGEDDFLVLFGDIMLEMDVQKLIDFHEEKKAIITFVIHPSDHPEDSSNVKYEEDGKITSVGRPKDGHPITGITRTSVQIVNKKLLDYIPEGKVSLEDEVVPKAMENGEKVYGYYSEEFIKDMGTPKRYKQVGGDLL